MLFLCLSGIATGLSSIFYFKACKSVKYRKVAPVDKLSVAIAIVLSDIFLGEKVSIQGMVGTKLIITATIVLIYS